MKMPVIERATSGPTPGTANDGIDPLARRRPRFVRRVGVRRFVATLDLDHDGEDHGPALRLLVQISRDAVLDLALQEADLADVIARILD
jgi:hypothetical protein